MALNISGRLCAYARIEPINNWYTLIHRMKCQSCRWANLSSLPVCYYIFCYDNLFLSVFRSKFEVLLYAIIYSVMMIFACMLLYISPWYILHIVISVLARHDFLSCLSQGFIFWTTLVHIRNIILVRYWYGTGIIEGLDTIPY